MHVMYMHVSIKCLSPQFSCPKGASDGDDRASFCHADYEWVAMWGLSYSGPLLQLLVWQLAAVCLYCLTSPESA